MPTNVSWKRMLFATLFLTVAATLSLSAAGTETSVKSTAGSANQNDWLHFNPQKFSAPERLVPSAAVAPAKSASFEKGVPSFPHDPTHTNVIYGRGKDELPTAIYAKAFDVLTIGGKLFQTPAAGEVKQISVNGQAVALYGTTVYTPLPNTAMVANPVQIQPFDPSRVFYKDKDTWPAVIYAVPGRQITIANQTFVVPPAGQTLALIFDASGHLKQSPQSSGAKSNPDANKESSKSGEQSDNTPGTGSSNQSTGEKAPAEKAASEKAATEKAASEKAAAEKAAAEKAAAEKAAAEKAVERAVLEKAAAEKAAADKAASEKAAAEKSAAAKLAAEKAAAEKAAAEQATAEKAAAEKAAADRAAAEKAAAEQAAALQAAAAQSAAEQAAADKAALEALKEAAQKAAKEKAAAEGADKAAKEKAEKDAADQSMARPEITGEWSLINTATTNQARVQIDKNGTYITATIVHQGSGYIPAGQVRFKGDYTSNPFEVTVQRAYPNYTDPYWEPGIVTVANSGSISIIAKTGNLLLNRYVPPTNTPDPTVAPSPQPKQDTKPTQPVSKGKIPPELEPKKKTHKQNGYDYNPSESFIEKIRNFLAGLSDEIKDWLVKNKYTIVVEYWSDSVPTAFANTDSDNKVISFQEYSAEYPKPTPENPNPKPYYKDNSDKIDSQLYSQGRHEIGHAIESLSKMDSRSDIMEAYQADLKENKAAMAALDKGYVDGHGDGRGPFTNKESGTNETVAQLLGYEIGGRNAMTMDVVNAFPKTAALVHKYWSNR